MTSVSKYLYIDKLDDIANKYNHAYHSTIKMKSVDGKLRSCGLVRVSKCKNIFAKGSTPNWSEEVFVIRKDFVVDFVMTKIVLEHLTNRNCKENQEKFRIEKVIKGTGNKWKGFDNSLNSWIGKKKTEYK